MNLSSNISNPFNLCSTSSVITISFSFFLLSYKYQILHVYFVFNLYKKLPFCHLYVYICLNWTLPSIMIVESTSGEVACVTRALHFNPRKQRFFITQQTAIFPHWMLRFSETLFCNFFGFKTLKLYCFFFLL